MELRVSAAATVEQSQQRSRSPETFFRGFDINTWYALFKPDFFCVSKNMYFFRFHFCCMDVNAAAQQHEVRSTISSYGVCEATTITDGNN